MYGSKALQIEHSHRCTVHEVNSSLVVGAYMCTIATEQPQNKVPVIHNVATRSTTCYKARGPPS